VDPYHVLGISPGASAEEIKKAYRREAMKWHPDRSDDSAEAKERFHQAAMAYRILSGREGYDNGQSGQSGASRAQASRGAKGSDGDRGGADDNVAEDLFWDVMLDYAIKLAQTGMDEKAIEVQLRKKGCPARVASMIAEKGYKINTHYDAPAGKKKHRRKKAKSGSARQNPDAALFRAFVDGGNVFLSPRDTMDYYVVVFSDLAKTANLNPLTWISVNRRLMRILNFSIILFAVIALAINFFPGPSKYKLLPDMAMLQLPFALLVLMFVWTTYRKMWIFSLVLGAISLGAILFFNLAMPKVLNRDLTSMLLIAATCFAPFAFIVLFGNYFYFRKAQSMIRTADGLFKDDLDKIVWLKNRAGTSSMAAFLFLLIVVSSLVYHVPRNDMLADSFNFSVPGRVVKKDDEAAKKIRRRLGEAGRFFEIAETHFSHSPPDYMKAEMAYSTAAGNGSVLAAYKLGYLYYNGMGVQQNDILALEYFQRAVDAPLAFQPHSLEMITTYLGESYNALGIMYQRGFGTRRNLPKAKDMLIRGVDFGSENARRNLETLYSSGADSRRERLAEPVFD
jgi:curved DNA-binding protein CbpA